MGRFEEYPCPICKATGVAEVPLGDYPYWKGVTFGTGGNNRGSGTCASCKRRFKIVGPPQMHEITAEEASELAEEYDFTA